MGQELTMAGNVLYCMGDERSQPELPTQDKQISDKRLALDLFQGGESDHAVASMGSLIAPLAALE